MKSYMKSRPNVAAKCLNNIASHTWYLHPTLIPFSLLDPGVSDEEKTEIAERILMISNSKEKDPLSFMYKRLMYQVSLTKKERGLGCLSLLIQNPF